MINLLLKTLLKPKSQEILRIGFVLSCVLTLLLALALLFPQYPAHSQNDPLALRDWLDLGYLRRSLEYSLINNGIDLEEYQQRKNSLIEQEDRVVKSFPLEYQDYIPPGLPLADKVWLDIGVDRKNLELRRLKDDFSIFEYQLEKEKLIIREDIVVREYLYQPYATLL